MSKILRGRVGTILDVNVAVYEAKPGELDSGLLHHLLYEVNDNLAELKKVLAIWHKAEDYVYMCHFGITLIHENPYEQIGPPKLWW